MSAATRRGLLPTIGAALAAALSLAACSDGTAPDPGVVSTGGSTSTGGQGGGATTGGAGGGGAGGGGGTPEQPSHCSDGVLSPSETDVDCGGPCSGCRIGKACLGGEDCETGFCVDPFFGGPSCYPPHVFSAVYGDPADQRASEVMLKPDGSVLLAGTFGGEIGFGGPTLVQSGVYDYLFLAQLDPAGNHVWSKSLAGAGAQSLRDLALDGDAPILGMSFTNAIDVGAGPHTPNGLYDILLLRNEPQGSLVWVEQFGGETSENLRALATDSSGGITMAGFFEGTTDFGLGPIVSDDESDIFLVGVDSDGALAWVEQFGGVDRQKAHEVARDSEGDILLAGRLHGPADFGGSIVLPPNGTPGAFVVKLDGVTRQLVWSRTMPNMSTIQISVDAANDVLVSGSFQDTTDFGTGAISGDGWTSFVAKLDAADGTVAWAHTFGGPDDSVLLDHDRALDIATRGTDVFVLALGSASEAFSQPNLEHNVLLRFDADGTFVYGMHVGGNPEHLDVDGDHGVLAGRLLGAAHYGGGALVSHAGTESDVLVVKLELP